MLHTKLSHVDLVVSSLERSSPLHRPTYHDALRRMTGLARA